MDHAFDPKGVAQSVRTTRRSLKGDNPLVVQKHAMMPTFLQLLRDRLLLVKHPCCLEPEVQAICGTERVVGSYVCVHFAEDD